MNKERVYPFPIRNQPSNGAITELRAPLYIIVNLRAKGMVHKASNASCFLHRDKRKSFCGWRAGGAASSVRFCATNVWPVPGFKGRICSKCFPTKPRGAASQFSNDNSAIHEIKD